MTRILFYISYCLLWFLALLPMKLLYCFSDILFFIFFYIIRYRKKIIMENLHNAFPEKTEEENRAIMRKYYSKFCDYIVETIKILHVSESSLPRHFSVRNPEVLDELYRKNKSVIAVIGHCFNWEWLLALPLHTKYKIVAIYKPLANKYFNDLINRLRSKCGVEMTSMKQAFHTILHYHRQNERVLTYFLADQTPHVGEINYWTLFLNQETPVYLGAEKIAQKTNHAVVFLKLHNTRRGYYEVEVIPLFENSNQTKEYEITKSHLQCLEEIIKQKPEYWLWSHRRWKYKRKAK